MKNFKLLIGCLVTIAMLFALLTGCNSESDKPTGETEPNEDIGENQQGSQSEQTDDNEFPDFYLSTDMDENGFWEGVTALDYVELFDYRAMPIPNEVHNVPDDFIQYEMNSRLYSFTSSERVTDRAVENGDLLNIDYIGSVDGVEFAGGSTEGNGTNVIIGVTEYIDDFLEQLIGVIPGETVNVEVTFPDYYPQNTDLEDKEAVFVTTVNYNCGKEPVDKMKNEIRSEFQELSLQQYIQEYILTKVFYSSIPEQIIKHQETLMLIDYYSYAEYNNFSITELLEYEGISSVDELLEVYKEVNTEKALFSLVMQAIAEDAGIYVSTEDLEALFIENTGTSDYSSYEEEYGLPFIKQVTLNRKVFSFILENAVLL
ncbi:MAG: FKBP-type peptidyl-prolyl cis-trans isomerase [Oscillospiraceae bacterium]|nr:FKBP-type peptidyl-prolyl cis-trans isomerase [Oscillospiraceae bacterium]